MPESGLRDDINQWIMLSNYDLETARYMQKSARYLYVLFCCQQAIEKRLKAAVVKTVHEFPPRTHDLVKLATLAKVSIDEKRENFLRRMTNYYIGTRYPEEVRRLADGITKQLAKNYLDDTEEMIKWLNNLLK